MDFWTFSNDLRVIFQVSSYFKILAFFKCATNSKCSSFRWCRWWWLWWWWFILDPITLNTFGWPYNKSRSNGCVCPCLCWMLMPMCIPVYCTPLTLHMLCKLTLSCSILVCYCIDSEECQNPANILNIIVWYNYVLAESVQVHCLTYFFVLPLLWRIMPNSWIFHYYIVLMIIKIDWSIIHINIWESISYLMGKQGKVYGCLNCYCL